jgi:hypothetical protein
MDRSPAATHIGGLARTKHKLHKPHTGRVSTIAAFCTVNSRIERQGLHETLSGRQHAQAMWHKVNPVSKSGYP